jgi:cell division septal protein FtsQ
MAILDAISPDVSCRASVPDAIRLVDRLGTPTAATIRWMLRLTTFLLLLLATFIGVQLATSAPNISPVAVSSQQTVADRTT